MASERRDENSLFLSLKEVQTLVEDRTREEEDAKQAVIDAERRAREDEIRRVKEAEESRVREAEQRARDEQEQKERTRREEQLRLEEAERRARIEAQARLEEARIRAEADAIANKPMPWKLIIGLTAGLLVVAGGGIKLFLNHQAQVRQEERERDAARIAALKKQIDEEDRKAKAEQKELLDKLATLQSEFKQAKTAEEQRRLAQAQRELHARMEASARDAASREKARKESIKKEKLAKCLKDPNDPLCGL